MVNNYTSIKPIYSLFNFKNEITNYLLNEYKYFINNDEIKNSNNDNNYEFETWEKTLNDALIKLGKYIDSNDITKSKKIFKKKI